LLIHDTDRSVVFPPRFQDGPPATVFQNRSLSGADTLPVFSPITETNMESIVSFPYWGRFCGSALNGALYPDLNPHLLPHPCSVFLRNSRMWQPVNLKSNINFFLPPNLRMGLTLKKGRASPSMMLFGGFPLKLNSPAPSSKSYALGIFLCSFDIPRTGIL